MGVNRTFTPRLGSGFVLVMDNGEQFPARIICIDAAHPLGPIVVLVTNPKDVAILRLARADGKIYNLGCLYDAPVVEDRWANAYCDTFSGFHLTREDADKGAVSDRIGLLHFQIIDGKPSNPEFVE